MSYVRDVPMNMHEVLTCCTTEYVFILSEVADGMMK